MKNTVWTLALTAALTAGFNVHAQDMAVNADTPLTFQGGCEYPSRPDGVDGAKATEAQMLQFQKDMKEYLAKGNDFLSCLEKEEAMIASDASEEQKQEFKAKIIQTHNAVVDEMNAIADQFNTALRAYKSQNP